MHCLEVLEFNSSRILERLSGRIEEERVRMASLQHRTNIAQSKVKKIATTKANSAVLVMSPAKFPDIPQRTIAQYTADLSDASPFHNY